MVKQACLVLDPVSDRPAQFDAAEPSPWVLGRLGSSFRLNLSEHRQQHILDGLPIAGVGHDHVAESVEPTLSEFHIIQFKGSVVVLRMRARDVMVQRSTGGHDNVESVAPEGLHEETPCAGGAQRGGE